MNIILISFCCVLLVVKPAVRSEESEHDSIKKHKEHNIDSINEITTTTSPNIFRQRTLLPNVHLKIPGYDGIPRKTFKTQTNKKRAQIPENADKILNANNSEVKGPKQVALTQNGNHEKPLDFLSNDRNTSKKLYSSEDSCMKPTILTQNQSNNKINATSRVDTTTKPKNIVKSTVDIKKSQNKHNHEHHRYFKKPSHFKNYKTLKNMTDTYRILKKEQVSTDMDKLEEDKIKDKKQDGIKFLNLHLKLSHVDAWNEVDRGEPIEIETTSSTNYNTVLRNAFSADTIELGDFSTKFDENELLQYRINQNTRNYDINQGLCKKPHIIEKQSRNSPLISYSELRPRFDKSTLNTKMFSYYTNQPQNNNNMYSFYQRQPSNFNQHQGFMKMPVKLNKPLIPPCLYVKSGNGKLYYEFNIPN